MALAFLLRVGAACGRRLARAIGMAERRDVGEAVAERYLRATGHRIVGRNWRSPRDPRDEADLLALTPDRTTLLVVEVKRAAGPWDALDRVDARKRAVLWRLLCDLRELAEQTRAPEGSADGCLQHAPDRRLPPTIRRALRHIQRLRCDLIGVEGSDRHATVIRHQSDLLSAWLRCVRPSHGRRPPPPRSGAPST